MLMASFSYISSVTSSQSRSRRVVVVEVSGGLAVVISYLYTGYAIRFLGYAWTFVFFLSIIFAALCYVVLVLSEANPVSAATTDKADLFTTKHFRQVLALYLKDDADGSRRHWKLRITLLLFGMTSAVHLGSFDVRTLFMLSAPLCFTSVWISYYYAISHLVMILTSLIMTHIFVHHVGDLILIIVGLLFGIGYELMFGLSTNRVMLFMGKYFSIEISVYFLPLIIIVISGMHH